jgi:hypothetical protein
MCEWGTNIKLRVPISAKLNHTEKMRRAIKDIDACIAPIVNALNKAGILTASCCCGHGKEYGHIWLHDNRVLIILPTSTKDEISEFTKLRKKEHDA